MTLEYLKYIYSRYAAPQYYTKTLAYQPIPTIENGPPRPAAVFDYRKYFDFGYFANAAAGFGGAQPIAPAPQPQQYILEKRVEVKPVAAAAVVQKEVVFQSIDVFLKEQSCY